MGECRMSRTAPVDRAARSQVQRRAFGGARSATTTEETFDCSPDRLWHGTHQCAELIVAPPKKPLVEITLNPPIADRREPLLVDSRAASMMLGITVQRLRGLKDYGRMPQPLRLGWGGTVRWRTNELREWVRVGCPRVEQWTADADGKWRATPELGGNRPFRPGFGASSGRMDRV